MNPIRTIAFFIAQGLAFGLVLGTLSGTLIYPAFGTIYAVIWGAGMGTGMGTLAGVLMALSDALFRREKMNLRGYRRKASTGIGIVTAVGSVIALIATTRGFLWSADEIGFDLELYLVLSCITAAIWSELASAYTTAWHIDRRTSAAIPGERIDSGMVILRLVQAGVHPVSFALGGITGAIYSVTARHGEKSRLPIEGAWGGLWVALAYIIMFGLVNGFLLLFVNRLIFKEYFPDLSPAQYKSAIAVLCFLATLGAGLLAAGMMIMPFMAVLIISVLAALIAAITSRHYADWLYENDEKFKGKPKETYLPAHALETGIAPDRQLTDDAETEKAARKS